MQTYVLAIRDRSIALESADSTLVRTSSGVDSIELRVHSSEWLDFDLSMAFSNHGVTEVPIELEAVTDKEWLAACTVDVPDAALAHDGPLGVCVHGTDSSDNHIITAAAFPLTVETEGA